MQTTDPVVGAFEAKTRLAELLRETEKGATFVIERRGKKVARLVPYEVPLPEGDAGDTKRLFAELKAIRSRVKGPIDVRALVEEGRR